jgi:hypothetical protein
MVPSLSPSLSSSDATLSWPFPSSLLNGLSVPFTPIPNTTSNYNVQLRSERGMGGGEHILINYGNLNNTHLLSIYGFTLPRNSLDAVAFSFSLPPPMIDCETDIVRIYTIRKQLIDSLFPGEKSFSLSLRWQSAYPISSSLGLFVKLAFIVPDEMILSLSQQLNMWTEREEREGADNVSSFSIFDEGEEQEEDRGALSSRNPIWVSLSGLFDEEAEDWIYQQIVRELRDTVDAVMRTESAIATADMVGEGSHEESNTERENERKNRRGILECILNYNRERENLIRAATKALFPHRPAEISSRSLEAVK